ncbi:acetoacetate metabolism regulatory protein AtoC [Clostridium aceticum]|uniref:Stage 0 sporulation protein A homolog n=1 Tax=Clostridium aceticum TaxID=84022 RepID=A0A0D8IFC2_9CLOT|nr:sigma-54 dependent transcriptional regulator [Clostridium aceticum]AKL93890.1 acetoacetate metabolism regulatory protein AtoC [Clostridium aceticum]KJF28717.1 regulator [Clostridium aceticum]
MEKILIIDDEAAICSSLTFALEDNFAVKSTTDPLQALVWVKEEKFDICLLDLKIGQYNGIEILMELKSIQKDLLVIIMTAYGTISSSVEAIKKGAYTYLTKPLNKEGLYSIIEQALKYQKLNRQVEYLSKELENKYGYEGIIGKSPLMKNVFNLIEKLKDVDTNVVVIGESGTGKELVARAIHYSGKRKTDPFVAVNCAAIPENLLESELFGYKKGAFSGAASDQIGKFQYANHGTIFLDEIGDMPMPLQAKLLRVLQQKQVIPLGSNDPIELNLRVIAATNKDLKKAVEEGVFRQDLYFRLNVVEMYLPPLREKPQDLPLLFQHFIQNYNAELNKDIRGLSEEAQECLLQYQYPGNIRELANIIEYAMLMAESSYIQVTNLPLEVQKKSSIATFSYNQNPIESLVGLSIDKVERLLIEATLSRNEGQRKKTAKILGISERGLRNKIAKYKLNE